MSDRLPAEIHIGGPIPRELRQQLIEAILAEGVTLEDYGGRQPTEELLNAALDSGQILSLFDDQARYGQFDVLEQFLVEHNIHFNRHSDSYCEHEAQWLFYRGEDEALEMPAEQGPAILLYRENVAEILDDQRLDDHADIPALCRLVYPPQLAVLTPIHFV